MQVIPSVSSLTMFAPLVLVAACSVTARSLRGAVGVACVCIVHATHAGAASPPSAEQASILRARMGLLAGVVLGEDGPRLSGALHPWIDLGASLAVLRAACLCSVQDPHLLGRIGVSLPGEFVGAAVGAVVDVGRARPPLVGTWVSVEAPLGRPGDLPASFELAVDLLLADRGSGLAPLFHERLLVGRGPVQLAVAVSVAPSTPLGAWATWGVAWTPTGVAGTPRISGGGLTE